MAFNSDEIGYATAFSRRAGRIKLIYVDAIVNNV